LNQSTLNLKKTKTFDAHAFKAQQMLQQMILAYLCPCSERGDEGDSTDWQTQRLKSKPQQHQRTDNSSDQELNT